MGDGGGGDRRQTEAATNKCIVSITYHHAPIQCVAVPCYLLPWSPPASPAAARPELDETSCRDRF